LAALVLVSAAAFAAVQVRDNSAANEKEDVPLAAMPSDSLTAADTAAALRAAGISMQRYDYEVGFPHRIVFSFDKYVGGKLVDEESKGGLSCREGGKHSFLLTVRRDGRLVDGEHGIQDSRTMTFWLSNAEGSFGGAPVYSLKGYIGESYGPLRAGLVVGRKVPIYCVVTNLAERKGIGGLSNADGVADIISRYDMAIIVYAEILLETRRVASKREREARPTVPGATAAAAAETRVIVCDVINLRYLDAVYVAWLFGKADLPKGSFWQTYARAASRSPVLHLASEGNGSFASLLPKDVYQLIPLEWNSQQLVVEGTADAIAELRAIIALMDRKPQQVILEFAYFPGVPVGADPCQVEAMLAGGRAGDVGFPPDPQPRPGVEVTRFRVATMNLVPAASTLPPRAGPPQALAVVTPRISGDRTITLVVEVTALRGTGPTGAEGSGREALVNTTTRVSTTTVNARDGEQFAYPLSFGESLATLVIRPRIVKEQREGAG
jgi:hypothetical protein